MTGLADELKGTAEGWITTAVEGIHTEITKAVEGVYDQIDTQITKAVDNVQDQIITQVFDPLKNFIDDNVVTPIRSAFENMKAWVTGIWQDIKDLVAQIKDGIMKTVKKIGDGLAKVWEAIKKIPEMVSGLIAKAFSALEDVFKAVLPSPQEYLDTAKGQARDRCTWADGIAVVYEMCYYPVFGFFLVWGNIQDLVISVVDAVFQLAQKMVKENLNLDVSFGGRPEAETACLWVRLFAHPGSPFNLYLYALCFAAQRFLRAGIDILDILLRFATDLSKEIPAVFGDAGINYGTKAETFVVCEWWDTATSLFKVNGLVNLACHTLVRLLLGYKSFTDVIFAQMSVLFSIPFADGDLSSEICQYWKADPFIQVGAVFSTFFFVLCAIQYRFVNFVEMGFDLVFEEAGKLLNYEFPDKDGLQKTCIPTALLGPVAYLACQQFVRLTVLVIEKGFDMVDWMLNLAKQTVDGEGPIADAFLQVLMTVLEPIADGSGDLLATLFGGEDTSSGSTSGISLVEMGTKHHAAVAQHMVNLGGVIGDIRESEWFGMASKLISRSFTSFLKVNNLRMALMDWLSPGGSDTQAGTPTDDASFIEMGDPNKKSWKSWVSRGVLH